MRPSEIESFLAKFRCLWLSGQEAQLTMNTRNGNTWITLSLGLGYSYPQPPPPEYSTFPSTPQSQQTRPSKYKSKNNPARKRRRAKRLANRTAATVGAEEASTLNRNETKNAAVQVLLPTLAPGLADAAVQADLPGEQVDVVDAL